MNEQQAYLAIRNTIRLENLSVKTASEITPELTQIFAWLGQQIRALPPGSIEREQQYRAMRQQIASIFRPVNAQFYVELRRALDEEVYRQVDYAQSYLRIAEAGKSNKDSSNPSPRESINTQSVQVVTDPSLDVSLSGAGVRPMQFTRTQLMALTRETKVLGATLERLFGVDGEQSAWIRDNVKLIDQTVKRGFLLGNTNAQIAAELPGVGRVARRRNRAIARTAVMDMSANAQEAFWDANSEGIAGWEFDASMDNRVCPTCAPWDGRTAEKRADLPDTPVHVNCRCRVLPLTETELQLRKDRGPQRRSVIELIEADSDKAAEAKARLGENVTSARAYSSQVTVNGKKYWRVSKDIVQSDHPLTMGEFLRQASPATQAQVLGGGARKLGEKRTRRFMRLIAGSEDRPPITPDAALREVTNFSEQDGPVRSRSAAALQPPRVRRIAKQRAS